MPDLIGLARLAVDLLGFLRQYGPAVVVLWEEATAFGQVVRQPLLLSSEEAIDVGRVATILTCGDEQVVLSDHAVGTREVAVKLRGRERDSSFRQRARDLVPIDVVTFLRPVLLPDLRLLLPLRGGNCAELLL